MKFLIFAFSILVSFTLAGPAPINNDEAQKTGWRFKFKQLIIRILGEGQVENVNKKNFSEHRQITLPSIPLGLLNHIDLKAYSKLTKGETEFDLLPLEKKRDYDLSFIREVFLATRKALPQDHEILSWINTLGQGGSREGIYQALVLDDVYRTLEASKEMASEKLIQFITHYADKFLNQRLHLQSSKKINSYLLKRLIVDKTLNLMEFYETRDLDSLYRWYAVVSAHFAKNYQIAMTSAVRKEEFSYYHYDWANKMPIQHIKSETILKLYHVMNGLQ